MRANTKRRKMAMTNTGALLRPSDGPRHGPVARREVHEAWIQCM